MVLLSIINFASFCICDVWFLAYVGFAFFLSICIGPLFSEQALLLTVLACRFHRRVDELIVLFVFTVPVKITTNTVLIQAAPGFCLSVVPEFLEVRVHLR
jgi:hypothetical protein